MLERIRRLLVKEFIQVFRNPRTRFVLFMPPMIQLFVFGYAATMDLRNVSLAIFDRDNSAASRELASRFVQSGYFHVAEYADSETRARELLDRGRARAVLHVERGFQEKLRAGRTAAVQLIVDGTNSSTAGMVLSYSAKITAQYSQELLRSRLAREVGRPPSLGEVRLETRAWFNENLESRNFYIPGIIAMIVTLVSILLTSMAVVREKEIGTMEQLLVTPIRPIEFILGKTVPFALIAFGDVILITTVGVFWFGVPIRGSILLLFLATALYLLTTLGVGLFMSTLSQTQQQASMGGFFFFFPAFLLSGFVFPIANMPAPIQWLTLLNPLRYFIEIIRALFLKGVGIGILWPQFAALAILGIAILGLTSSKFKKTLA
ncbi:MAG: ABC transporter permease [Acidobacteria bacterium]|nr:ABC transporter permease [Acidobacteriota bacterium]